MKKFIKSLFTSNTPDVIEPMKVIQVGQKLPFNTMGDKQNPALYIHTKPHLYQ